MKKLNIKYLKCIDILLIIGAVLFVRIFIKRLLIKDEYGLLVGFILIFSSGYIVKIMKKYIAK